jgi:ferredoxin
MAVEVDKEKCIGCGACVSVCPDGFEMGSDGKSHVKNPDAGCVEDGKNACPVNAIST